MQEYKLIIFDLGGVVTSPEVETLDQRVAKFLEIPFDDFRRVASGYKSFVTKGMIGLKQLYDEVTKQLHTKKTSLQALDYHLAENRKILSTLNQDVLTLVDRLKTNYKVAALANTEREVVPINRELGLYQRFEHVYLSCEMGMEKPEARIYNKVLGDYKCKPENAIFIDDKVENVLGARQLGILAIQYRPKLNLEAELKSVGVIL